jgi:hypothetical protein
MNNTLQRLVSTAEQIAPPGSIATAPSAIKNPARHAGVAEVIMARASLAIPKSHDTSCVGWNPSRKPQWLTSSEFAYWELIWMSQSG